MYLEGRSRLHFLRDAKRNTLPISRWGTVSPLLCQPQLVKCCLSRNSRLFSNRHGFSVEGVASCYFPLSMCFKKMKKEIQSSSWKLFNTNKACVRASPLLYV